MHIVYPSSSENASNVHCVLLLVLRACILHGDIVHSCTLTVKYTGCEGNIVIFLISGVLKTYALHAHGPDTFVQDITRSMACEVLYQTQLNEGSSLHV